MSLGLASDAGIVRRFDTIVKLVGAHGRGISMSDLAKAHRLAQELESPEPDREAIAQRAAALGIDVRVL